MDRLITILNVGFMELGLLEQLVIVTVLLGLLYGAFCSLRALNRRLLESQSDLGRKKLSVTR